MFINPESYHLVAFELINPLLLYLNVPSFECRFCLKDMKSKLLSFDAFRFRNLNIM